MNAIYILSSWPDEVRIRSQLEERYQRMSDENALPLVWPRGVGGSAAPTESSALA